MVKIKTAKEISPKIYAYTTPTVTDNEGWIKIGYTERDVATRIKEQTHTANIQTAIRWTGDAYYLDDAHKGEVFKDHDFHHFLRFHEIDRRPKTEWFYFNGNPEQSEQLFDKFIRRDVSDFQPGKGLDYQLRQEQRSAVAQTKDYFDQHPNSEFLWNAKPRFGKTLTTYDLIKEMTLTNVLIVTNRPAIANSWYDDFDKFIAGKTGYKFVSESDSLKERPSLSRKEFLELVIGDDDIKQIAFLSLQDLKGSLYFGGAYDKLKWVADTPWDMLVIDEAHEGVDTFKTDIAFQKIKRRYTLHLSGTPFKALAQGKFSQDQIYNWSYADEQASKETWDNSSDEENPYEALPQLNMFTYQMSRMIVDEVKEGAQIGEETIDYAFDLNEFFATNESGKFIHEEAVETWLDTLTRNEKYPFSTKELRNEMKHTFWLLDRVASAKALKAMLEDHPVFESYAIVLAAGNGKMSDDDDAASLKSLEAVRQAVKDHDKTITLSVGQLTTGVTIPEWSGVMMLSNIKSPALYMQAAFRAQNPYQWTDKKGHHFRKERAYVFDFVPERTLILFDEFANNLSIATAAGKGTSQTREDNIRQLLNFFPVIAEDSAGQMVEIDAKSVMTIPKQIKAQEVLKRGFMSNLLFDNISGIFQATQTVLDILNDLPIEEQGKTKMEGLGEFPNFELDEEGNVQVSQDIIINQQGKLFGDGMYSVLENMSQVVEESLGQFNKDFIKQTSSMISEALIPEISSEYGLKSKDEKALSKTISQKVEDLVKRNEIEFAIQRAHLQDTYQEQIASAETQAQKEDLQQELASKIEEIQVHHRSVLTEELKQTAEELPAQIIEQEEIRKNEKVKVTAEEEIRGHLRGFARTIPSFLMAYGDENLTLANFDTYVPDEVFKEVTGISLSQFTYLRDGGDGFAGHLFDAATFDEAIQEFLRKKIALSDYFTDQKEDIFDYIPPQKTNQIFTTKRIVKKMVDDLEKENPGIFDDSSKTFIDLYMKSGLYIAEIVKRLYNSHKIQAEFPNREDRLKHILEHQVYGFAPSEIIYRIATNFIFGGIPESISRKNFVQEDTIPYAKEGTVQELVDKYFE